MFATLKAIVDDEKSTICLTISLRVAWPLVRLKLSSAKSTQNAIGIVLWNRQQLNPVLLELLKRDVHQVGMVATT